MKAVWLIQLGTPEAPTRAATKKYLDQFLMDPRMIELPYFFRLLLVKGIITPFRSGKSAKAYASIWMNDGSPLMVHSRALERALQADLGDDFRVVLGMRYGHPSIQESWNTLRRLSLEQIDVVPLFPQYSSATSASVYDEIYRVMSKEVSVPALRFIPPFFRQSGFIESFAQVAKDCRLEEFDHFLFSFHGLPEKLVRRADSGCLQMKACCERTDASIHFCYRAQCYQTAWGIQKALQLPGEKISVAFQSRLAGAKWLDPYTDQEILKLPSKGVKKLAVFCPSFVADCLETLEEIGERAREDFIAAGGQDLQLIPSLNAHPSWVKILSSWLR
jgi:ferrochelatase